MRNARLFVVVSALVLLVAACGGKSAEEQLLEEILENSSEDIGDIDISTGGDGDDFSINIQGEDEEGQDFSITGGGNDDDFEITISGEDGEQMTIGGGEIPDELVLPYPPGGSVSSTFVTGSDVNVSLQYPAAQFDQLVSFYDSELGSDAERSESTYSTEDGTFRNVFFNAQDGNWTVGISDCVGFTTGEFDTVCVTLYQIGE
ncbi:MAG: hypothetical protein QNJ77_06160 [Acidimicrobiia bacterium]|nr:hypothetical protein [Acidimicrobiia bacterium]